MIKASLILLFISLNFIKMAYADKGYVLEGTTTFLRAGPGLEYKILKELKSKDPLEILDQKGDWYFVELPDGTEGWVLKGYMTKEEVGGIRIGLREELKNVKDENSALKKENDNLKKEIQSLKKENESLIKEISAHKSLMDAKQKDLEAFKKKYEKLKHRQEIIWIGAGASIVLIGWILGFMTERFRNRGKRYTRLRI